MKLVSLGRVSKFSLLSFWRNIWLSTATILIMALTLFSLSILFVLNVVSGIALDTLKEKVDVSVYLNTTATDNQITQLKEELLEMSMVETVDYKTQEEALEEFKQRHKENPLIISSIQELEENPLQPSLTISAKNTADYPAIVDQIEGGQHGKVIDKVNYEDNREVIDRLTSTTDTIKRVGYIIILVFSIIVALVIFNTIRLTIYTQRDEVRIMKLVGATNMFVRLPYIFEGFMYGVLASVVSTAILYPILYYFSPGINDFIGGNVDVFSYFVANLGQVFGIQLLFGILLGTVSSYVAIRRYLRA